MVNFLAIIGAFTLLYVGHTLLAHVTHAIIKKRLANKTPKYDPRTDPKFIGLYSKDNLPSHWRQKKSSYGPPIIAYSYDRTDGMHVYRNLHSRLWGANHKLEILSTPEHPVRINVPMCETSYLAMALADHYHPIGSVTAASAE